MPHFAKKFPFVPLERRSTCTRTRRRSSLAIRFGMSVAQPSLGRTPARPAGPIQSEGFWPFGADDFSDCRRSTTSHTHQSPPPVPLPLPPQCSRRLRSQSVAGGLAVREDWRRDAASYLTSIHRSFRRAKTSAPRPRPRRQRPPFEFLIKGCFHSGRQACNCKKGYGVFSPSFNSVGRNVECEK